MLQKAPQFGDCSQGTSGPDFAIDFSCFAPKKSQCNMQTQQNRVVSGLHRKESSSHLPNKSKNPSAELI